MKVDKISELTTNRLSVYLRCLNEMAAHGEKSVSSEGLAKRFHLNSAQIRKDLAYFGEFGVRGVGYYVKDLREHLQKILGLDRQHCVCIIGAGRLGTALTDYYGFKRSNFNVVALFDADKNKIGEKIGEVEIFDIKDFQETVETYKIDVAVIAVPAEFAQGVLDRITQAGIKAVMNFAPVLLRVSENVKLNNVDFTTSLESLSYFLTTSAKSNDTKNGKFVKPNSENSRN